MTWKKKVSLSLYKLDTMLRRRIDHYTVLNKTKKVANWSVAKHHGGERTQKQVVKKQQQQQKTVQKETNIKNGQSTYGFIFLRPGG